MSHEHVTRPLAVVEPIRDVSHVIAAVECVLERIRSGESVAVAFVEVNADGSIRTNWARSRYTIMNLVAGTAELSRRLLDAWE